MRFLLCMLFIPLVISCGEASRKDLLPRNSGSLGEVILVAEPQVLKTSTGDALRKTMNIIMYGLPQDELLLKRIEVEKQAFNDLFQTHRNVLLVEIDPSFENSISIKRDVYSRQQVFINVRASSEQALLEIAESRMKDIFHVFYEAEIDRLIDRNRDFGQKQLNDLVQSHCDIDVVMQDKFQVALKDSNFIWLRLDQSKPLGGYQHTISQGFLIYTRPYVDTSYFSDSSLLAWKNSINKKFVEGPQNSYMSVSNRFILPASSRIQFNGQTAVEIRGLWRMEGYFMGGPFYALSFYNPENGLQYMAEGYVYCPQFDKALFVREIEAIAKSIRPLPKG